MTFGKAQLPNKAKEVDGFSEGNLALYQMEFMDKDWSVKPGSHLVAEMSPVLCFYLTCNS